MTEYEKQLKIVQNLHNVIQAVKDAAQVEQQLTHSTHIDEEYQQILYILDSKRTGDEAYLKRDRKSTRLNSSHSQQSRMPSSA